MKKALIALPFVIIAISVGAFAENIDLNPDLRAIGVDPWNGAHISIPGWEGDAYVGFYILEDSTGRQYTGLCVDPAFDPINFTPYTLTPISELKSNGAFTEQYREVAWLLNRYSGSTGDVLTAVQLAAWSIMFTSEDFQFWASDLKDQKNLNPFDYLAILRVLNDNIAEARNFNASGYYLAANADPGQSSYGSGTQDYIVCVPEPGLLTLLGIAFAGIGVFWKKING
jgi:hypothetical protein